MENSKKNVPLEPGAILSVILSAIEGIAFFMAGFNLVQITDWMALISGIALLILSAGTFYGVVDILLHHETMYAYYESIASGRSFAEMCEIMEKAEEED